MGGNLGNRWLVVIASMCGLMVGTGAILIFATSVFLRPVSAELGITRGDLSGALLVATLFTAISCPIVGWLVDRYGARKLMLAGLPLYALCVAGFGFMQAQPFWVIPLLYGLLGFIGGLQTPIPYAYVVNRWFDRQRGLALGIATAGVGLGVALLPPYLAWMIGAFGWRQAYWGLAITVLVLAWLPVVLFVREPGLGEAEAQRGVAVAAPGTELPGDEASTAFKTRRFWALTIAFFLAVVAINGTLTHIIPLMMDRGIQLQQAAFIFSFAGYAIILGRIIAGWCLDRIWGPYVAIVFFVIPMIGIALLGTGDTSLAVAGAVLCGAGIGAEIDLMAFFVSRYFGLKAYGRIYGLMFAIFNIGTGLGPALSGKAFDAYHSYSQIFTVYGVLLAVTCLLLVGLGPYPYPARKQAEA